MEKFTCQLVKNSNYHVVSDENYMAARKKVEISMYRMEKFTCQLEENGNAHVANGEIYMPVSKK